MKSKMPQTPNKPRWLMHGITSEPVENYIYSLLPPRDEVLSEMEAQATKRNIPIVGPAVGRILHQLALISGGKNIFEMGSAIGYSTIWWARAIGDGGRVVDHVAGHFAFFVGHGPERSGQQGRGR